MPITSIGALIKIIIGTAIGYVLFNYVNIIENQALGVGFGFLAVLLIVWGVSYFFFLILRRLSSIQDTSTVISASYRLSLIFGIYVLGNIAMMMVDRWTIAVGILMAIVFMILEYSITLDARKKAIR